VNDSDLHFYGGIDTFPHCDTLKFDYTQAPANGCIPTGITQTSSNFSSMEVYPNPVVSFSLLQLRNEKVDRIEFFNSLGIMVKSVSNPQQNNIPIVKKDFAEGIYLYRIQLVNGKIDEGKFVVE
jgi:hypothetical protein